MEEERRLAGPGLGDATAKRILAVVKGLHSLRRADSILTTVGVCRARRVMRRTQWGMPDKPPFPQVLMLLPTLLAVTGIRRREESSPIVAPLWLAIISIALEEEARRRAGGGIVDRMMPDAVTVSMQSFVIAAAPSSPPLPLAPPPGMGKGDEEPMTLPRATRTETGVAGQMIMAGITVTAVTMSMAMCVAVVPMMMPWSMGAVTVSGKLGADGELTSEGTGAAVRAAAEMASSSWLVMLALGTAVGAEMAVGMTSVGSVLPMFLGTSTMKLAGPWDVDGMAMPGVMMSGNVAMGPGGTAGAVRIRAGTSTSSSRVRPSSPLLRGTPPGVRRSDGTTRR